MENEQFKKLMKKVKLIYSVELLIFAVVFAVLGTLILTEVISIADWKRIFFTYATMVGSIWIITDLIWMTRSPKRRAKNSFFDKIILLPVAVSALVFDITMLSMGQVHIPEGAPTHPAFHFFIGIDLIYLSLVYIAQTIYHWYHPLPSLVAAAEEALAEEEKQKAEEAQKAEPEPVEAPASEEAKPEPEAAPSEGESKQ